MYDVPTGTWVLLIDSDPIRQVHKCYLVNREHNDTVAMTGTHGIKHVPEGAELPVWLELAYELFESMGIDKAFKHVYRTRTVVEADDCTPKDWIVRAVVNHDVLYKGPYVLKEAQRVMREYNRIDQPASILRLRNDK